MMDEVGEKVQRQSQGYATAYLRDLGVILCDAKGRIVVQGDWVPGHTGGAHIAIKAYLDKYKDDFHPGDFFIGNDPYVLRFGHLPDWSFLRPVFYKGELVFFTYLRTHQADAGGSRPGGYHPRCYDIFGEGLLIPPIRICSKGVIQEEAYELILRNLRLPSAVRADNMLTMAAMKKAEERLVEILDSYGKDTVLDAIEQIMDSTEQAMREAISKIPAGVYKSSSTIDCDGRRRDVPLFVRLTLTVKPEVGEMIFDFSESGEQVEFVNSPLGQTWASVFTGVLMCVHPRILRNDGMYRPITVIAPEGSLCNPVWPATMSACAVIPGTQITEAIQLALAQVVPEQVPACWSRHVCPIFFGRERNIKDPRTGTGRLHWVCSFNSDGSSGAIYGYDGWNGLANEAGLGVALRAPLEIDEHKTPWRYGYMEWETDSSGDGEWRGGMGTRCQFINTQNPETFRLGDQGVMTGNGDGERWLQFGLMGGTAGCPQEMWIIRKGEKTRLRTIDVLDDLEPGDIITTVCGGGGGVGDPLNRPIEKVRMDALNEYISIKRAKDVYGVIIDPETFEVDQEATNKQRGKLKKAKRS